MTCHIMCDFYLVNCRLNSVGEGLQVTILQAASRICVIIARHNTCNIILNIITTMAMMMMTISIEVEIVLGCVLVEILSQNNCVCLFVWFQRQLFLHRLDQTVEEGKDDGLVHGGGDARGDADGVDKLEAEGEDGGEE